MTFGGGSPVVNEQLRGVYGEGTRDDGSGLDVGHYVPGFNDAAKVGKANRERRWIGARSLLSVADGVARLSN